MTLAGTFRLIDVQRLDLDRKGAIGALKCRFNQHLLLIDVSACDVSTPEVAAALHTAIENRVFRAKRCAMVVASAGVRMQAKRVVSRSDMYFCEDVTDARGWLLDNRMEIASTS